MFWAVIVFLNLLIILSIAKPMYTQLYVPMELVAYIQPQMPITMPMPVQQNMVEKPQQQKEEENYWACESENTIMSK